jgi:hypothetical protein
VVQQEHLSLAILNHADNAHLEVREEKEADERKRSPFRRQAAEPTRPGALPQTLE